MYDRESDTSVMLSALTLQWVRLKRNLTIIPECGQSFNLEPGQLVQVLIEQKGTAILASDFCSYVNVSGRLLVRLPADAFEVTNIK